ncbi:pilus (MSHA type) biogenesis protein MshL [Neptunicella marina]|uniref:Pilus (MSHA type) biogenesis protein MshL n=1 Tax=Neptunicella marina TaxID=2125989 RepID=A0A8J6LYB6_9ALTE|nr:pilus (MSHA type) biogenesis protein MshL [Neptunicella marina]MBC3766104.1 pilus (MSHA type) biogenesis protein MshL [Neptunicella marina]
MHFKTVLTSLAMALLVGCQSQPSVPPVQQALEDAVSEQSQPHAPAPLQTVPAAVASSLAPEPAQEGADLYGEPRYDIKADNVEARAFFAGLMKDTPYSVAVHPDVQGTISVDLKQVTLSEVLDIASEIYGYDIKKSGKIFRIYPAGMRTETFAVNYLLMQRNGMTRSMVSSGGVSQNRNGNNGGGYGNSNVFNNATQSALGGTANNPGGMMGGQSTNGTNISTTTQTDFWKQLKEALESLIGSNNGRSVIVSPQAGLVTVKAMPDEIRAVKTFLSTSEEHVQRQVVLEARIIEVVLNDEYQQGINWQKVTSSVGNTDFNFTTTGKVAGNAISASLGGITSLAFVNQDFSGVLSLLSTQGNVQVLSSPRVTATNNQKAVIKVGDDEYFVTDVSSQNTVTAAASSSTPNIELTPFFSGIALDVTPQIDQGGNVMLHVHPSVIDTKEQEKVLTLNEQQMILPLAQSNIRESDTVIRARSGEIVVIGGLMQSIINESESKTPLLGDIPLLGNLFKSKRDTETKKELVILLKPTVVETGTWKKQLERSQKHITDWTSDN